MLGLRLQLLLLSAGSAYIYKFCEILLLTASIGGVICLLNCDNERDLNLLNSQASFGWSPAS
jgi:hypothetical protein